jgi:ferredoxin-nitrate reductase
VPDQVHTLCPYCGVGCGLLAKASEGRLTKVEGDRIHPVNRGRTCRKPLELASAVHAADRATVPLLRERRDLRFREASWEEAISGLASRLRAIVAEHGPRSVAFYISGQLLSEDYYAVNKLAKGFLGTNNVDSNSRLCMSSAVAGYSGAFGFDGPPPSYADIGLADCLLLLGTNTAACHPIVWSRIRERRAEGATVICVDPRRTQTARESSLHLPVRPGTDLALLSAMLHVLDRDGLLDKEFIARSTSGWEEAQGVAREWSPRRAGEVCGVEPGLIEEAARRFGAGPRSMALWSMGANQSRVGTLKNRALINLCLASGQIGRPGTGPLSLTGQPNAMGGRETGGLAHLLPGYRRLDSAEDRAEMARLWKLDDAAAGISPQPGLAAVDLFEAVRSGEVKALWVVATNPAVSLPDSGRVREALEAAELLVVQDAHHPTETSALADAVLPAAAWPEKQGTMTNSERRVGLVRRLLDPPGEALPDWEIFARLARELGFGEHFAWRGPAEVFAEFAACTAGRPCDLSGISHERLAAEGSLQWPCPSRHSAGTERLYETRRFPTPDGRARFAPTPQADPAERPDELYPLILTSGRVAEHWHTMSRTGKSARLRRLAPEPLVELNPADAERIGVREGARARIVSRRGEVVMRVTIAEGIREGVAFVPFHWGAGNAPAGSGQANAATNPVVDPDSKQPELKAAAVRIEPVEEVAVAGRTGEARRLVVVGAGMAGLEVVQELAKRTGLEGWKVTMLGEEPGTPYNRMLLSKLLAGEIEPPGLELRPRSWFERRGVELRTGCRATAIDTERRTVTDAAGEAHAYDALVLATGSRAFVPPIPGLEAGVRPFGPIGPERTNAGRGAGVLSFRTVADVGRIEAAAAGARSAVVVGGGLLGLEAAAGLRRHGLRVTVVEAAPYLMPQQLDPAAAAMLAKELAALGIESRCGGGVESCRPGGVTLTGGEEITAEVTVVAAGVRAETSLAREAGIEVGRGVLVDDEMRTSAPSVWAVGECAEHRGTVYGLWAPVAAQARVAGASLAGDAAAFHPEVAATNLKVAGVSLFAGGAPAAEGDELVWLDGRRRVYRRLVLDGERLVAATLLGDVGGARELSSLLRSGEAPAPELLAPPGAAAAPPTPEPGDLICSCNAVTRGQIETAISARALCSTAEVGRETRAGTGCGSCLGEIEEILRRQDSSIRNTDVTAAKRAASRMPA